MLDVSIDNRSASRKLDKEAKVTRQRPGRAVHGLSSSENIYLFIECFHSIHRTKGEDKSGEHSKEPLATIVKESADSSFPITKTIMSFRVIYKYWQIPQLRLSP